MQSKHSHLDFDWKKCSRLYRFTNFSHPLSLVKCIKWQYFTSTMMWVLCYSHLSRSHANLFLAQNAYLWLELKLRSFRCEQPFQWLIHTRLCEIYGIEWQTGSERKHLEAAKKPTSIVRSISGISAILKSTFRNSIDLICHARTCTMPRKRRWKFG